MGGTKSLAQDGYESRVNRDDEIAVQQSRDMPRIQKALGVVSSGRDDQATDPEHAV
jgi:hypothetical protein